MSDLKARVLANLRERHGIDEDFIADQLAVVIEGKTKQTVKKPDKDGKLHVVKVTETQRPQDVAAGLRVLDGLHKGKLGIAERVVDLRGEGRALVDKFAPKVDTRIIHANADEIMDE